VRVRFAPSPTGSLHVGGARTALYNWILARSSGGRFVLRIEDTDEARSTAESERSLQEDLRWLGLDWDEGPDVGGPFVPYRQSERIEHYRDAARRLVDVGAAYESWAKDEEIDAARAQAERENRPYRFDRARHEISRDEAAERSARGERPALRLAVPHGDIHLDDLVRGEVRFPDGMFSDFVLLRSSGMPTYNFACAVDDGAMEITHVVRGEEHLSNTGKQVLVHQALGRELPRFAHLPLILDHDRSKLSKRSGGATVGELRARGFLPEGVLNMLALQGWHPPGEEERLTRDDLLRLFDLGRVRKAGGIYDLEKMASLNAHWLHAMAKDDPARLAARLAPFLAERGGPGLAARAGDAVRLFADGAHLLADLADEAWGVEREPDPPASLDADDSARTRARSVLASAARRLGEGARASGDAFKPFAAEIGRETGTKGRELYGPIRQALIGREHGPDMGRIVEWLGESRTRSRLERALRNDEERAQETRTAGRGGSMRRVAVVMGGESQERDVSRVTGTAVARALASRGYEVTLLDTERGRIALAETQTPKIGHAPPASAGTDPTTPAPSAALETTGPKAVERLAGSLADVDVVFLALHGGWGEDGTIQGLFEMAGIPYTGSGVLGSAVAMDKDRAKRLVQGAGVPTPAWRLLDVRDDTPLEARLLEEARTQAGGGDVIVKPNAEGSTVGLTFVGAGGDLRPAVREAARFGSAVLVEKFVPGRELTVSVLGTEVLPIVEIIPTGGIYTYQAKYTKGQSRYEVPAKLSSSLTQAVQRSAYDSFAVLGLEGFARIDYRLAPDESFWFLEANTIPGMTPLSLVPMAAKAAGISFEELVERIVELGAARTLRRARTHAAHAASAGVAE
jgi:glutamyl-tRNA synthetase